MAIRFVVGRAGSGKTHHCVESIRSRLRDDPIDGPRLVLLVPEQASLQMEREILAPRIDAQGSGADASAAHRAEVLSFQRLAYRVLEATGRATFAGQAISEPARAMVLRHLVGDLSHELHYYRRIARPGSGGGRVGGFIARLSASIAELIQEAIDPDALVASRDAEGGERPSEADDAAHRAKLHDLHLIYKAYLAYLGTDRLDPSQYLDAARRALSDCDWLDDALLFVDGFASLSGQELLTLVELARRCQHVDITIMIDPTVADGSVGARPSAQAARALFARTARTYGELRDRFLAAGLTIEDPLVLDEPVPRRFFGNASLDGIERGLGAESMPQKPNEQAPTVAPDRVELIELPSRRVEVDYVVSQVCRWVREPATNYRYRDIAVIARDLEPYHDLISAALTAQNVPFFIDRRRPVAHHPLVELLRAGVSIALESISLDAVRLLLKTDLMPLDRAVADELENYLVAYGLSGIDTWRGDDWALPLRPSMGDPENEPSPWEVEALRRINNARRALWRRLDSWTALATTNSPHSGSAWAAALVEWMDALKVAETLESWAKECEATGDLDQAEEHRQILREVTAFLDDLSFAFSDINLSLEELSDVLEAGLSNLTLGLVPPTVDQVLVGSIERSRHPDIKAAIVIGFNDGVFPHRHVEDSILNDDDRSALRSAGVRVQAGTRERVLDERMVLYITMTRASERLVVCYATSDNDGTETKPSPYMDALCRACPGLAPRPIADPIRSRNMWDVWHMRDAAARLALEFRTRPDCTKDDAAVRSRWNELYASTHRQFKRDGDLRTAMASLGDERTKPLSSSLIERLYHGPFRTSVSQLESFAACPFQHFAKYILRLRERPEATLEPIDVGTVHHAILDDLIGSIASRGRALHDWSEAELTAGLQESCERITSRIPEEGVLSDARSAYRLRRAAEELARVLRAQRRIGQSGVSRPRRTEVPFGFDVPNSLPAFELFTPSGRRVLLRGYIDRVDIAELADELLGVVVDYKTTRDKRLDLGAVYHGVSLQLVGYLLVLAEVGETLAGRPIRPIGSLFVSLAAQYERVDDPSDAGKRAVTPGTFRPRGLLREDAMPALETSASPGRSEHYNVFRKKDGGFGHPDTTDTADARSFQALLDHTRYKLGELADGILDGDVVPRPCRLGSYNPCAWCPMITVCRFELGLHEARFLESLRRTEVFRRTIGSEMNDGRSADADVS